MGYSVRNGRLVKQERPKWVRKPTELLNDPEWGAWFEVVKAKMAEMFGPDDDEHYTREQEEAAEAALAQEGKYPPADPCPL